MDGMDKDRSREDVKRVMDESKGEERRLEKRGGTSATQAIAEKKEKAGEKIDGLVRNSIPFQQEAEGGKSHSWR